MQPKAIDMIPRDQHALARSLLFTTAPAWTEYVAENTRPATGRTLLETRRREARLSPKIQDYFASYPDVLHWLVLADESPDTAAVLPVLARLADLAPRIDLRILSDDDANLERLANVLEVEIGENLSDADLPLLLILDEEWNYQENWGPHPHAIEPLLDDWLAEHPTFETLADDETAAGQVAYQKLLDELNQAMRLWYNSHLAGAAATEIHDFLESLREEEDGSDQEGGDLRDR